MVEVTVLAISKNGDYVQLGGPLKGNPRLSGGRWFMITPNSTFEIGESFQISNDEWDLGIQN